MGEGKVPEAPAWAWLRRGLGRLRPAPAPVARPRTAVVTDSAAALPASWSEEFARLGCFASVTLPVMAGDEIFTEGQDVDTALGVALAAGRPVRTSRPSPGQFERAYRSFEEAGFEGVVSLHLSGGLSGTADAARLAAERVGIPVEVVDSRTAGMALGFAVRDAVLAAADGADPAAVRDATLARLAGSEALFYVPSLEQLRRGGRIGTAASLIGTMLAIKPILTLQDGLIVPLERVRTSARALTRLRELALDKCAACGAPDLAVHYFGNADEAEEFAAGLARAVGATDGGIVVTPLPAVLAAHTGLGVLAVVVSPPEARQGAHKGDGAPTSAE
ncbi:DegV family protein [Sinomonas mesophila]|uniref:DegV family protein n=1 Tax=Sinomonas mesophila TaxID=1531955 RepID=UPI0009849AEC|nr:DegV family protein [Sinomonas mesophila]